MTMLHCGRTARDSCNSFLMNTALDNFLVLLCLAVIRRLSRMRNPDGASTTTL
jgi:hypothetical protein